ncbi:hypothetical protein [Sneathiella chinensis]|uniref:Uncharacterized protein n=1 Tax=Sneathiella chinensis TaxID=349750 RepID=A0ABQ5TZD9_9PROT|nr:hypothetical protein [Sneathiella chinensis]GLQ04979.1 hypothetical protein GCM10007924_02000 [Sneathiella chinensis]
MIDDIKSYASGCGFSVTIDGQSYDVPSSSSIRDLPLIDDWISDQRPSTAPAARRPIDEETIHRLLDLASSRWFRRSVAAEFRKGPDGPDGEKE